MRSYTVFLPPYGDDMPSDPGTLAQVEDMVLVKEGFFWLAALVPLIWLIANRLWLAFLGFVLLVGALSLLMPALGFSAAQQTVVLLGVNLIIGFEAHNLKAWGLRRRGWREAGLAVGRGRAAAERDFLRIYEPRRADNDFAQLTRQVSA